MDILKAQIEEQLLIKCYVIKHVILLIIKAYDRYQRGVASKVYKFFDKKILVEQLKMKIFLITN